jgi:hypothetical protein
VKGFQRDPRKTRSSTETFSSGIDVALDPFFVHDAPAPVLVLALVLVLVFAVMMPLWLVLVLVLVFD